MPEIIRISLDTEFNEQNLPPAKKFGVDFISIGLVNIDKTDQTYYAVSSQFNRRAAIANEFVAEHVLPKLEGEKRQSVQKIAAQVKAYLQIQSEKNRTADKIEFWSKNGTYDEFILCRLFGGMNKVYEFSNSLGLKKTSFRDLDEIKYPILPHTQKPVADTDKLHHALYDAKIQADLLRWVETEAHLEILHQHEIAAKAANMTRSRGNLLKNVRLLSPLRRR